MEEQHIPEPRDHTNISVRWHTTPHSLLVPLPSSPPSLDPSTSSAASLAFGALRVAGVALPVRGRIFSSLGRARLGLGLVVVRPRLLLA